MKSNIDMAKHEEGEEKVKTNQNSENINVPISVMQEKIRGFCEKLLKNEPEFDVENTMDYLVSYLHDCHRILYSAFSNHIYQYYQEHSSDNAAQAVGTMLSHIEKLISYAQTTEYKTKMQESKNKTDYEDASKAVIKIWDHINLAQQQYTMLKMSDTEYKQKIDERLTPFQKELNSQLLTMIGIFTALAFLLFGGISSLENLFANAAMPMLKFMVVGSIWAFCLLNLLYIFLLCVGKMANLSAGAMQDDSTVFQKYAIVWWSDFILGAIMSLSLWAYYLQKNDSHQWFDNIFLEHSSIFTLILIFAIGKLGYKLLKATKK